MVVWCQPATFQKSFLLVSVVCFVALFVVRSVDNVIPTFSQAFRLQPEITKPTKKSPISCNFYDGSWVYSSDSPSTRYDSTCNEIFKGWNCVSNNKSNGREIVKWRWQPRHCDLPAFEPTLFLETFRGASIGFVGDSLNRNMFISLICTLKHFSSEIKKWRPAKADRGYTFLRYNLTVAYHRTNLLVHYERWSAKNDDGVLESRGYKNGYVVNLDTPERTWADAPSFHNILIVNTGHWWWAHSNFDPVNSPMLFYEKGQPVIPVMPSSVGLEKALKYMVQFVEKSMHPSGIKFFCSQSPRHFEGGDWNQGGSCSRLQPLVPQEVEKFFSPKNNGTNIESSVMNEVLLKALEGSQFHVLNITHMSQFRADAHPSIFGRKKHEDCMHWCVPGITDTWNDLLVMYLTKLWPRKNLVPKSFSSSF